MTSRRLSWPIASVSEGSCALASSEASNFSRSSMLAALGAVPFVACVVLLSLTPCHEANHRPRGRRKPPTTVGLAGMDRFTGAGGVEIAWQSWMPEGDPVGAVVIAHGVSEHSDRYAHVAKRLNEAGYAVAALDHRGHGDSERQALRHRPHGQRRRRRRHRRSRRPASSLPARSSPSSATAWAAASASSTPFATPRRSTT